MRVKIAFASDNRYHVNQHFGVAQSFICYAVTANKSHMIEVIELTKMPMDGQEEKLTTRMALLDGCAAVYCQAIGSSAIAQLVACGIQPLKVKPGTSINHLLAELQQQLKDNVPPTWLSKYLKRQEAKPMDRFAALEEEGWQE